MRLITFISMVVLPFITCTASKSPVCPRAKEDDLSSSCMSSSYLDIEDKQTDRILERKLSKRVPPRNLIILKAIIHAQPLKPPVENTGFTLAWTEYGWWPQIPAILKTYFRSTGSEIQDECSKWKAIGGLIAISLDSHPDLQHSVFHIILGNAVPYVTQDQLKAAILAAFCGQIKEPAHMVDEHVVNHALANPQEFHWRRPSNTWIATPIYFATQTPIDIAILTAKEFASGPNFILARTTYKGRHVTLKNNLNTRGSPKIDLQCANWRKAGLLIGITVGLLFNDPNRCFYAMLLANHVPDLSHNVRRGAIEKTISARTRGMSDHEAQMHLNHYLANPQEFVWRSLQDGTWTATPIRFHSGGPADTAIRAARPFIQKSHFSIARTSYNGRGATLKTYKEAIDWNAVQAECDKWRNLKLLVDSTVEPAPYYTSNQHEQFHMIMGNAVPTGISMDAMAAAINKAHGGHAQDHHFDNPQEYAWKVAGTPISHVWSATYLF